MKILQVINALTIGGAQSLALDLALYGRQNGHSVEIAAFRGGELLKAFASAGFKVHILGETAFDFPAFLKLNKIINEFKPDLIHSHLFRADFWARLCTTNKPVVLITSLHGRETKPFHVLEGLLGGISNEIVMPSNFLKNWYITNIKKRSNLAVIPPGANIRPIRPQNGIKARGLCVGTLSRLHPIKGIDLLLHACKQLFDEGFEFNIKIGGSGLSLNSLKALAKALKISDKCEFAGQITDRAEFLEQLDIFAAPSRQEAFGISICEAMERSVAVIASDVGGIPELVTHNETGLLFEQENVLSLKAALKALLSSAELRNRLKTAARAKVLSCFNRQNAVKAYYELYKKHLTKQILFAVSSNELGGGERLALSLMTALKQRGWGVFCLCSGVPLSKALKNNGIPYKTAEMRFFGLLYALALLKEIVKKKPAIISTHLNKAALFGGILGKLFNTRVVSHIHGLNNKSYYGLASSLIAVSKAVYEHMLKQGAAKSKITVITNSINKQPASAPRIISPSNTLRAAITAKLHKNKGHRWLFEALAAHKSEFGMLSVAVFGDGPERSALEELVKRLGLGDMVRFYGFVNDVNSYYQNIDISLLPSLGEGIPLSLLETMRLGIPCIATNIGGIPEIVFNQKNGLLVEPRDEAALIAALNYIANPGQYALLSQGAIDCYKKLNNYNGMVDAFESVLTSQ